jgi:lipopolysaccharide transport system permease protein
LTKGLPPFEDLRIDTDPERRAIRVRFRWENRSRETALAADGYAAGWQLFDPDNAAFLAEGEWTALDGDLAPGQSRGVDVNVALPAEDGRYRAYVSLRSRKRGWFYRRGWPFVILDAEVAGGRLANVASRVAAMPAMMRARRAESIGRFLAAPWLALWRNRALILSMARRDLASRYRGSFGDALWTVIHPLLLMATYFFVFGLVLQSRFGADPSRTGFALYFIAGLLPWMPFADAVGRAPAVLREHRNFVKKMVYPVETLPVHPAIASLAAAAFALAVFGAILAALRGGVPASAAILPALVVPQLLMTIGLAWLLATLGVFVRDLGQVIGFLLTVGFFITPICYPESSWPRGAEALLKLNPMYALVRGYRFLLLEGTVPYAESLVKLWAVALLIFYAGYAWFHRLRRAFPDVI